MGFLCLWEEIPIWQGIDFKNTATREKAGRMIKDGDARHKNRSVTFGGLPMKQPLPAPRNNSTKHMKTMLPGHRLNPSDYGRLRFGTLQPRKPGL